MDQLGLSLYWKDTRIVMNSGGTPVKEQGGETDESFRLCRCYFYSILSAEPFVKICQSNYPLRHATTCGVIDSVLEHRYYPESAPGYIMTIPPGNNPPLTASSLSFCAHHVCYVTSFVSICVSFF